MRKLLELFVLSLLIAAASFSQTTAINGTVVDPSGAVIPNATVAVTSTATGFQRSAVSDPQGRYNIPQLAPGPYKVTAKATGFADFTIEHVELQVDSPATIAIRFEKLGSTTTVVS